MNHDASSAVRASGSSSQRHLALPASFRKLFGRGHAGTHAYLLNADAEHGALSYCKLALPIFDSVLYTRTIIFVYSSVALAPGHVRHLACAVARSSLLR